MTPQEIFDTVAKHLFTQGKQSTDYVSCLYRGPEGTKCAVGILIPDAAYDADMEGCSVAGLFDPDACQLDEFSPPAWMAEHVSLLQRLQNVHDVMEHWVDDERMRWELSLVAQAYELDDSILPGLSFNRPEQEAV
jgi:hypothetical protein